MPENQHPPSGRIVYRTSTPAWAFHSINGDLITYLPNGGPEDGETYARAWNDCALRTGRYDLVIIVAVDRNGASTLIVPDLVAPEPAGTEPAEPENAAPEQVFPEQVLVEVPR